MKKVSKIIAFCLCFVCVCVAFTSCAVTKNDVVYELHSTSDESFLVGLKTGKNYTPSNPTDSTIVIMDLDGNKLATIYLVSKAAYDSYKTAAGSLSSYNELKKNKMEGFSYNTTANAQGTEDVYVRCYAVTNNTAMFMESSDSDESLDKIINIIDIKQNKK